MPTGSPITDVAAHFESKLIVGHEGGHWSLATRRDPKGYHVISVGGGRVNRGHRVAYELFTGPIPPGLVVDHQCEVKWCCNPAHLEPVTNQENLRRAYPTCARGHRFAVLSSGRRWCPECQKIRRRGCPGK